MVTQSKETDAIINELGSYDGHLGFVLDLLGTSCVALGMNQTNVQAFSVRSAAKIFGGSMMCFLMSMMVAISSSSVFGQADTVRPPQTKDPSSGGGFMVYVIAVLLVAIVVTASILKSKRSHQD